MMYFTRKIVPASDVTGAWTDGTNRYAIANYPTPTLGTEQSVTVAEYAARHGLTLVNAPPPEQQRAAAYLSESDPLLSAYLSRKERYGGDAPLTVAAKNLWLAKVAEIKACYPES